jgi:tetratricopeptide (TPR) repeat protein
MKPLIPKLAAGLLFGLLAVTTGWAQPAQTTQLAKLREEADKLYLADLYEKALPYYSQLLALAPNDTSALNRRGNCYLEMEKLDSAFLDFRRAIRVAPSYASPYYNLALAYAEKQQWAEAIYLYQQFAKLKPDDPAPWIQQGDIYHQQEKPDSAHHSYTKAHELDPKNLAAIYYLAVSHFYKQEYPAALRLIEQGQALANPEEVGFYYLAGTVYAQQKDFRRAYEMLDQVLLRKPNEREMLMDKVRYKLLANTPADQLDELETGQYRFREITNQQLRTLGKWALDSAHRYYFPRLQDKFAKTPHDLGLDEYFMLYLGQSEQPDFQPASNWGRRSSEQLYKAFRARDYEGCIAKADSILATDPLNFSVHYYCALAHAEVGNQDRAYDHFFKSQGLITAIFMVGDGKSPETAFLVIQVPDEYTLLSYMGYEVTSQALVRNGDFAYDRMSVVREKAAGDGSSTQPEVEKAEVFFNIQKSFDSMAKMFGGDAPKKNKKEKKKRKKDRERDTDE